MFRRTKILQEHFYPSGASTLHHVLLVEHMAQSFDVTVPFTADFLASGYVLGDE
jgi:hypothetical protein